MFSEAYQTIHTKNVGTLNICSQYTSYSNIWCNIRGVSSTFSTRSTESIAVLAA